MSTSLCSYPPALLFRPKSRFIFPVFFLFLAGIARGQETVTMKITRQYLNIPIGKHARKKPVRIALGGRREREFVVKLAEDTVDFWIYIDVSELKGKTIGLICPATKKSLARIYQADRFAGQDSLYREKNRPQYHFTVKRGWSNDINGPVYLNGLYHLFWQAHIFDVEINVAYMYWGHATSPDLLHWTEQAPALLSDSLGSPWSGTAVIDTNNTSGFGKNALVLYYTAYDHWSEKQVQCIAYSNDGGKTFHRYGHNPVIDSNDELGTNQTRDPKVFWYAPAKTWAMVLFEDDGVSIYNSADMLHWKRQSHYKGVYECPDMFELPVDGDTSRRKWVLHGGGDQYFIGSFDGKKFTPESEKLSYVEGLNANHDDIFYAAQTFSNMPDGRRVQIGWGRFFHQGMPFSQGMLFPVEFSLVTTAQGIRLQAHPIREVENLHAASHALDASTCGQANTRLKAFAASPLHVKMKVRLGNRDKLCLRYGGSEILNLSAEELPAGTNDVELLLDRTVAEIFVNQGQRYILHNIPDPVPGEGLVFESAEYGPAIEALDVYEMKSIW